jgi:hypothetical protein
MVASSLNLTTDNTSYFGQIIKTNKRFSELRLVADRTIDNNLTFHLGTDIQVSTNEHRLNSDLYYNRSIVQAAFAEVDLRPFRRVAVRVGLREESAFVQQVWNLAPRISAAYQMSEFSQISFATGTFYQLPQDIYLFKAPELGFEKATHYILTLQRSKNSRILRIEGYFKNYSNLVRELNGALYSMPVYGRIPVAPLANSGSGFAKGLELFWYDKRTINRLNYWISYSFLNTERIFANYPIQATPTFAADHNFSLVAKYAVPKSSLMLGISYNLSSGRPYYNPRHTFLSDRLPTYNNLTLTANYAWFKKSNLFAVYFYVDNILGFRNVNGYYFTTAGQQVEVKPLTYRSIFAGINLTLAKKKSIMGIKIQ